MSELEKTYNPSEIEKRLYEKWVKNGYFHAEVDRSKKPFTIVMPPPNITGQLHMGHALDNTMQDILIRMKRMQGYNALWQPGTDHAAIATEVKITEALKAQGIDKADLGREKFLERAWEWKKEYGGRIINQLKSLGSSADWDRERFTMDEGNNKAVNTVFKKLYDKGWIYKGSRIVNWCPVCQTSISDAEVIHEEQQGNFWHIKYPVVGEEGRFVEIATTRPETMLGDTAVAVNPDDERYKDIVGKMLILPLVNKEIPVIADSYVDKEFGTGCVKITPAHDPNDFEVGKRHNLPEINIMNDDATIANIGSKYDGMDRYEARRAIVEDLDKLGLLVKIEPHTHQVGTHDRCKTTVEPLIKPQWFVKMEEMARPAKEAVVSGKLRLVPERMNKVYYNWLDNIRDWCISRQLWWGHRIPVWYHNETGEIYCEVDPPKDIENYHQDEDVLDTWFSSALWPFTTLGWPEETEDFKRYYPTSCMVTGYDIIFFWVARMAFSARHFTNDVPFKDCLIHGLIRDEQGRKMSKSLGNGIDPIDLIDQYGADALRLFLSTNSTPGLDMNYSPAKMEAGWNFINKLWNASRYVLMNCDETYEYKKPQITNEIDHWIVGRLNEIIKSATVNLDRYELAIAGNEIMDFVWNDFCSSYIEFTKSALNSDDLKIKHQTLDTLIYVLEAILKLLHPFIPFVTEEIYQSIHGKDKSIMVESWPLIYDNIDQNKVKAIDNILQIIKISRELRTENNIKPSKELNVMVEGFELDDSLKAILYRMTKLNLIDKSDEETIVRPTTFGKVSFIMSEIVDKQAELEKIDKELKRLEAEIARSNGMLNNEKFLAKAPKQKVDEEKEKLINYQNSYDTLLQKKKEIA
jgi:valyl-tRNA synthetase